MEYLVLIVLVAGFALVYFKKESATEDNLEEDKKRISELEKSLAAKEEVIKQYQQNIELANVKISDFEQLKTEKIQLDERLKNVESERNTLKTKNTTLENKEEARNESLSKSLDKSNTLQESLEKEKERLNDERVKEKEDHFEKMKKLWGEHEKDVEKHIQMICKNLILKYIPQEKFPYPRNKPDNTIEISSQLIVFDAKSPSNDDLSNFPKYIKSQTENLKKYAKHADVKKELFLVVPSNTLEVIEQFTYNMGDYNVYIITKDALEPIILSLKRIQDFELVEKLSPEERDDICRIIGKFAHTTKRRIQIDQYFADEFLDTLKKAGTQLPREILKSVIDFEGAEMLNPPMEKRNKNILTKDLKDKSEEIKKEIALRNIPDITTQIEFKKDNNA
jgi:signal recognition particle subunit SEC65